MRKATLSAIVLILCHSGWAHAEKLFKKEDLARLDATLKRADSDEDRSQIRRDLVDIFSSKAVAELEARLEPLKKGGQPLLPDRKAAAERIYREVGNERMGRVRRFFRPDLESSNTSTARAAMWWFLIFDTDPAAKSAVLALLKSENPVTRFEAARQLASLSKDSAGEPILLKTMETSKSLGLLAAEALSRLKHEKALAKALEVMKDPNEDWMPRSIALDIVAEYDTAEAKETVVRALNDRHQQVVGAALGRMQSRDFPLDQKAVDRLFELIDDPEIKDSVKLRAVWSLKASTQKALTAEDLRSRFLERLGSKDIGVLAAATTGVRAFGGKNDVKQLMPLLDHANPAMRAHVEANIGMISGTRFNDTEHDLDVLIAKRKEWWAKHSEDREYQ